MPVARLGFRFGLDRAVSIVDQSTCRVNRRGHRGRPCSCRPNFDHDEHDRHCCAASRRYARGLQTRNQVSAVKFSARRQPRSVCPSISRTRCALQIGHSVPSTASWWPDSRLVVVTDTCWPHRRQSDSLTLLDKALSLQLVDRDLASDRVRLLLRHVPLTIRLACRRLVRAINRPLKRLAEGWRLA